MSETQEQIVWEGSQSQVLNFGIFISMGIVSLIIIVLSLMFFPLAAVLVILPLIYIFIKWLIVRNHRYKVTTERIFYTTGIFSKKTEALELYRVRDVDMYEPFWQRLFKLGNVALTTSDKTAMNFLLKAVPNPGELMNNIRKNVELRRDVKRVRGVEFLDDEDTVENLG
ncbi:MAG TPA: PH domain-containing protein [Ignavibacteria bacterium]|nr:PH domain-containing protein [Ignavibacteria bacterium]HMQ98898.1 PH domain-containing protein [Ignavibacteria bacterium]